MKSKKRMGWVIKSSIIILLVILLNLVYDRDISFNDLKLFFSSHEQPPAVVDGPDTFTIQLQPPWGQLYVDGQPLQHPALNGDLFPLQFPVGKHLLRWQSEQFQPQQCTFFVPVHPTSDKAQTCNVQVQATSPGAAPRYTLAFPVWPSLAIVQKPLQQPLLQAIQRYLNGLGGTTTVQPGEQYRYNAQTPTYSARQPLQASLSFALDTDVHAAANCTRPYLGPDCTYAETGADCRLICSIDWIDSRTLDQSASWTVGVVTRPNWTYRTAGQSHDPNASQEKYQGDQQFTTLRITWEHQAWHVSAHSEGESGFDDPNCMYAIGAINSSSELANVDNGGSLKSANGTMHITGWNFISGQNRALGCLVKAQMQSSPVGGKKAVTSSVYFLYRFGVLAAVDKTARSLNPQWPLSRADVKHILPEILTRPAFTT